MNDMELNEMRQQMALLKEKLDQQQIINEQLLRQTIDRKISTISRISLRKRIYLIACIFIIPPMLVSAVQTPLWFAIATAGMLAVSLIYHEVFMDHISTEDVNRMGFAEVSLKALRVKEQGARWLWIGIPMLIAWVLAFIYVVLHSDVFEGAEEMIVGGLVTGIIVGAVLGYAIYRRQQQLIDDLRYSLDEN